MSKASTRRTPAGVMPSRSANSVAVPGPTESNERANRSAASPGNFTTLVLPKSRHVQIGSGLYSAAVAATLEVSQLCVRYTDITAVSGVSFRVNPGEIVALLGANGAGKTSTLESCIGLRRPTSGHIAAFGSDPTSISARVRTGVMLQTGGLYPSARPLAWLEYLARLYPTSATPRDLLEAVGIDPTRRTTNRRLSGGEQQRVKLAAALLPRPDLLYLDEPTAGVDLVARRSLVDLVRAQAQRGAAILLTTHLLTDVDDLADRVVVLDSGRVRAQGTLDALTGATQALRFTATPGLAIASLQADLGSGLRVSESGAGNYLIEGHVTPDVLATATAWCARMGVMPQGLTSSRHSLEELLSTTAAEHSSDNDSPEEST